MADTTEEEFREEIAAIVKDADLSGLTARKVRRQLEEKFGADFTDRKAEIDGILIELINEKTDSQEDSEADERNGENGADVSDSSVSDVSDIESDEKKAPQKKKSTPAKKKTPAKPATKPGSKATSKVKSKPEVVSSDDEKDLDDEELARKLQEEENGGRPRRRTAKKVKKPAKSDKPKKPRAAGTSIYSRPCDLTPELAAVMGTDKMPRKDVVKTMWDIVRERNLQDPSNRQFMLCDEQLLKVFGKKRVRTFGMMKYLKKHMTQS